MVYLLELYKWNRQSQEKSTESWILEVLEKCLMHLLLLLYSQLNTRY